MSGPPPNLGPRLDRALADRNWSEALELLRTWTANRPDDVNGWLWTAACLERTGKPLEARDAALRAQRLDPADPRITTVLKRIRGQIDADADTGGKGAEPDVPATLTENGRSGVPATLTDRPEDGPGEVHPENTLWTAGDVIEGRYEVRDVRRGGMGEVYFVFDRALALDLAVKTPLPGTLASRSGRLRFLREAEAWIGLGLHINICTAFYVRRLGGVIRLFIEFIDGVGLDVWMHDPSTRSMARRLDMAIQIAAGMHHAQTFEWFDDVGGVHSGLAHRDLKPANVLVSSRGIAKVTDFGLVGRGGGDEIPDDGEYSTDAAMTVSGGVWKTVTLGGGIMGTPPYMPPEQWGGGHGAGKPADVYAFGCILYELFCGRRPFGLTEDERRARPEVQLAHLEERHRTADPPAPRSLNPDLSDDLAELMLQCLEKAPGDRPPDFGEIRNRLIEIYRETTTRAYPRKDPRAHQLLGDALNNQGVSYATLGQEARAERTWEAALSKDPRHLEATFNLAVFQWRYRGASNAETLSRIEETLHEETPTWKAPYLAGKLALATGAWDRARAHLERAFELSGMTPEVVRDHVMALSAPGADRERDDRYRTITEILERPEELLRKDPALLTASALARKRLGDDDSARSLYAEARRHDPSLPPDLHSGIRRVVPGAAFSGRLEGFSGRVVRVALDSSGETAATVLQDGDICLWDVRAAEIRRMIRPAGGRPRCVALTPGGDRILSATEGEQVAVWDAASGRPERRLRAHTGFLNALCATTDGRRLAAVGTTGALILWNLDDRDLIAVHPVHSGFLTSLDVAADCRTAIVGGSAGKVIVVTLDRGEIICRPDRHPTEVTAVVLSRGAKMAASGDADGEIRLWNLPEGRLSHRLLGHRGGIRFLSLHPGDRTCLSIDSLGVLRLWDIDHGSLLSSISVEGDTHCAAATEDRRVVLVGHGPGGLSRFDFSTVPETSLTWAVSTPIDAREAGRRARRFADGLSRARALLASGNRLGAIKEVESVRSIPGYGRSPEALKVAAEAEIPFRRIGLRGAWLEESFDLHDGNVNSIAISPDGKTILSVGADRRALLTPMLDGGLSAGFEETPTPETACIFQPDGRRCALGGLDNTIRLVEAASGRTLRVLTGHGAQINTLDARLDLILSGSSDATARLWEAETGVCLQAFEGHAGEVVAVSLSPDGRLCASSAGDELLIWDPLSGRDLSALRGHSRTAECLVWPDEGRTLVSAGPDGELRLWDVASAHCLRTIETGHTVTALALTPDDRFALTGGSDGAVKLWDIRARRCLRVFEGHIGAVTSIAVTPDGRRMLSAGDDGVIRRWFLDWETSRDEDTQAGEAVRPYLEVFLSLKERRTRRPTWNDEEIDDLVTDLSRRGLGPVDRDLVASGLERLAADRRNPERTMTMTTRIAPKRTPVSTVRRKEARRKTIRTLIGAGVALLILFLIGGIVSRTRLQRDPERALTVRRSLTDAKIPYALPQFPAPDCEPALFRSYLRTFLEEDDDYDAVNQAGICLARLRDGDAVGPLLELLRPPERRPGERFDRRAIEAVVRRDDVLSILVAIADDGADELRKALFDRSEPVRKTAALALAANGGDHAAAALFKASRNPEPLVRIAVSEVLEPIAARKDAESDEVFKIFEKMARDPYPEVRTNVARALRIFRGSRPRALLEELSEDVDAEVRTAADETLAEIR